MLQHSSHTNYFTGYSAIHPFLAYCVVWSRIFEFSRLGLHRAHEQWVVPGIYLTIWLFNCT